MIRLQQNAAMYQMQRILVRRAKEREEGKSSEDGLTGPRKSHRRQQLLCCNRTAFHAILLMEMIHS